jgi:hypothetical protein
MSFRTETKYLQELKKGCPDLQGLDDLLGRSHIIKFKTGGFFPPHRDLGESIRLIAFFNSNHHNSFLMKEGQRMSWLTHTLYYFNTKKEHSYFNFADNADVLVLNLEVSDQSRKWIRDRLMAH